MATVTADQSTNRARSIDPELPGVTWLPQYRQTTFTHLFPKGGGGAN